MKKTLLLLILILTVATAGFQRCLFRPPPTVLDFCSRLIVPISMVVASYTFLPLHLVGNSCRNIHLLLMLQTIQPFALTCTKSATSASADFSAFVVTILGWTAETSRDKTYIFHRLLARFTHQGYGHLWELRCLLPTCPLDTPCYLISVRQATISLLLLLSQVSPLETCKSL